jgi:hypothetical protein
MVIWLASYPRSGNTFFRILLNRVFGFQTHSVYSGESGIGSPKDARVFAGLVGRNGPERDVDSLPADSAIHFVKTHDLPVADGVPAIALIRDGRDAMVSYTHYFLKTEKGIDTPTRGEFEDTLEHLIRDEPYGGWSRNVNAWAERVGYGAMVRYEDLIRDPICIVAKALKRFSLNGGPANATAPSFEELHAAMPWFFRRGTPGGWADEMPVHLEKLFVDRHGATLQRFGY